MQRSLLAMLSSSARASTLSANASARQSQTHCAARIQCRHVLLPVVLVASEPVTNTVPADAEVGAVDDIGVELVVDPVGRHIALAVTDSSDRPLPEAPGGAPSDDVGGRGLLLWTRFPTTTDGPRASAAGNCRALFRCPAPVQRWPVSVPERLECADA
jgi:hypothetical protein